jgi:DNA-binding transcriptional ArsR family regulator
VAARHPRRGGGRGPRKGARRSHRLLIALALREGGELCVCHLGWNTSRADNLVGHHLRTLGAAGLATSRREGKIVFYTLTAQGRELVDAHVPAARVAP